MIITIRKSADPKDIQLLVEMLESFDVQVNEIEGAYQRVLGLVGDTASIDAKRISAYEIVENVTRIAAPYKLVSRSFHPNDTIIDVDGIKIGGNEKICVIAGPCAVESLDSVCNIASIVKEDGALMLRGGAYKPRTSPYSFQGMETEGVKALSEAKKLTGLPVVSEIMSKDKLEEFEKYVDIIQVGARNMQNFDLLKALGKTKKPVLLKRGLSSTIEEWLMSAEYIVASGNPNVILCERGIRTYEKYTRNTLDISVIPIIKERTHLPIIIDPSHSTGDYRYVEAVSLAAIAAGADGLIIEVHDHPESALSDGGQSLKPEKFARLMKKAREIAKVVGRDL